MSEPPSNTVLSLTVLVIGDPHFKVSNVRETERMSQAILELARERHPDLIVCLGDVLDRHETIHVTPLTRASELLFGLSQIAPLIILIGNHDRPNNSTFLTEEHPFGALKHWSNTTVVDTTKEMMIRGHRLLLVPYVAPGRFEEALGKIVLPEVLETYLATVSCLFAHQEFFGAKMGAIISQVGDKWALTRPLVISGHIHDFDELQPNIIYTGTPLQHAFGDRADKTVSWVILEAGGRWTHERIDLRLPKKILYHLSVEEIEGFILPPGQEAKIIVSGTTAALKATMKLAKVKSLSAAGVKIVYKDLPSESKPYSPQRQPMLRYGAALYSVCRNEPGPRELFEELFGSANISVAPTILRMVVAA